MSNFTVISIPTIKGQTTIKGYKDGLEIMGFNYGMSIAVASGITNSERTTGKPHFSEISFSRYSDSATPQLMQACAGGTVLKGDTVLTMARFDEKGAVLPLIVFTLKNVVISNLSVSGGGDVPMESISLTYSHIQVAYDVQKAEGGKEGLVAFKFDLATNVLESK